MRERGLLGSGGLFISRPRSVTLGLGIAGTMAGIGILTGLGMLLGYSAIYAGLSSVFSLPDGANSRSQAVVVLLQNLALIIFVIRALRPRRIPRFITIGISGVTGVFWFFSQLSTDPDTHGPTFWINVIATASLMVTPAFLLMSESASEFYGD